MTLLRPYPWLDPVADHLSQLIDTDQLGHAPMLAGPPGIGKAWLAEWLTLRLLCLSPQHANACGECRSCQLLPNATHPDFFRLDVLEDKSAILVDQVREWIDSLNLTPSIGERRVGLIQSADRMNENAANALLKTLEEPAQEVWLILVSERPEQLPATVLSRCQRVSIPLPSPEQALEWLHHQVQSDRNGLCELALRLANGSPQTAARWLNEGQMEFALKMREQLNAMLRPEPFGASPVSDWLDHPKQSWHWLARWSQAWMSRALTGSADGLEAKHANVSGEQSIEVLQQCWQQALEGGRMAEKPIRQDWMMHSWVLKWRSLAPLAERV